MYNHPQRDKTKLSYATRREEISFYTPVMHLRLR